MTDDKIIQKLPAQKTSLMLAYVAIRTLREHNKHQEADILARRIKGDTPYKKALDLTKKYIQWHENKIY